MRLLQLPQICVFVIFQMFLLLACLFVDFFVIFLLALTQSFVVPNITFLNSMETSENRKVSSCFQHVWKCCIGGRNGLTLSNSCISESCIKIKINSNFYFYTSLRHHKEVWLKSQFFFSSSGIGTRREGLRIKFFYLGIWSHGYLQTIVEVWGGKC